jgi:predicted DNA-binding transcriptional regulator AlpA
VGIPDDIARDLASDHRARRRLREDIMLRFMDLAWQDQYKVYRVIQGYFIHSGPGSEAWRETQRRAECVAAVQKVAEHLGLPEDEAPGVDGYERGRKELGLALSASTIVRRWQVWREVAKAARGERVAMTARQRATLRAAINRRPIGEEWFEGIREWLAERGPSTCEDGEFVGIRAVALVNGITVGRAKRLVQQDGFPRHAFTLARSRVWHLSDVEAHHANEPFPSRVPGGLQPQVMTSEDICRLCGLSRRQVIRALERTHLDPRLPRPAGKVTGIHYWFRISVEAWSEQSQED